MKAKFKKLYGDKTVLPTKADEGSAGLDLYAHIIAGENEDLDFVDILPHTNHIISVGFAMEIPNGTYGAIFARSGLASKQSLRPANCVGVVDSTYRGEVFVALHNDSDEIKYIHHKDRIAQMIIQEYPQVEIEVVNELSETERGEGGFGHSGR